jgi:hypothetical protein
MVRRIGFAALAGLLVWFLLGLHFFVFPRVDAVPHHADVVFALGPPLKERVAVVERLLDQGRVDAALVSVPYYAGPPSSLPICHRAHVICADPSPSTTRGEGAMLHEYAKREGWSSAVVVTMTAHISRARSIIDRCFHGKVSMVESGEAPAHSWFYQYLYQTGATVKSWLLPSC